MDIKNKAIVSKHLFRVQKIATKDCFFKHHLETNVEIKKELSEITWIRTGLSGIEGIIKVRTNHIGNLVQVGEYAPSFSKVRNFGKVLHKSIIQKIK